MIFTNDPETNLENLRASNRIFYEVISGSHMYGTSTPESDIDIRGCFAHTPDDLVTLPSLTPPDEVAGKSQDTKFFELGKFIDLAAVCNPTIVELLWPPESCIKKMTPLMRRIIEARDIFPSRKAVFAFVGYAQDQIERSIGQNKMVNNPQPEQPPVREDFCSVITRESLAGKGLDQPCRPKPLSETSINLSQCHCAGLEKVPNAFRLYDYGEAAKGVFRNGQIVCESIPMDDENPHFTGILIYNENEYDKALKQWKRYWTWRKERNEARWSDSGGGNVKNMMHCIRLLLSGIHLLRHGEPIVKFKGDQLNLLREIRAGKFEYDKILAMSQGLVQDIEMEVDNSPLQSRPDLKEVNDLYKELRKMAEDPINFVAL